MPNSPVLRGLAYIIPTFGFMLLLPSVLLIFIVMLYLTVAYFVAANSRPDFRRSLLISFGLAVVALGIATIWGTTKYYQLAAWRTEYPIQSLASRLAYEPPQSTLEADVLFMLSNAVQKNLEAVEVIDDSWRGRQLAMLHNINFESFVAAEGFGQIRVVRIRGDNLKLPPVEDVSFSAVGKERDSREYQWNTWQEPELPIKNNKVKNDPLQRLHWFGITDFLQIEGFGYVASFRQAAGFASHAFHYPPLSKSEGADQTPAYQIDRLELVSLLKHDRPMVYVLDVLPRMDRIVSEKVPVRELDEFETAAIVKLRTEEDIVIEQNEGKIRMLGSRRAGKNCLECHSVHHGELLGAFTYQILERKPAQGTTMP